MSLIDATQANIRTTLENVVRDIGHVARNDPKFNEHTELFDSGYIGSLGIVSLTAYIEQEFDITLTEEDLFDPKFTTIDGIAEIIAARTRGNSA
ncbi:MAG: acyl carrier protein [Pseudonocardiaceae bacterium]